MEGKSKATIVGEVVKHTSARTKATCEISAEGVSREDIDVNILSPSKVPASYSLSETEGGLFYVEFVPQEVGTYIMDVYTAGVKIPESPVFYKVYDSSLIKVSEASNGVVGQPCQFRVDASQAGEGQLEISINDGEVPNHVQVLGGGRCLVHFTPEAAKPHTIDIKFNSEAIPGCPFVCRIADTSKVSVALHHLELFPVNEKASFQIHVDTADNAELAVSVAGPRSDLPVQVTGNIKSGFLAEFLPEEVGPYVISVEYNNIPVGGTPFTGKSYDASKVLVSSIPWGTIGKAVEFTVDASKAGEGNLEITISARGRNIPTQVHPQGSARFVVGFVPLEGIDHIINITFNKEHVPGAPFTAKIHTDPNHIVVSGHALAATAVGKSSTFTLSNVIGALEDIEIAIDAPTGDSVPAQVTEVSKGSFKSEFCPRVAGEHQIYVSFGGEPVPGSPFPCKVYNVAAIQVRECKKGIVGKPVTFLVETSQAGPGNLEVTVNNGQVPTSAQAQGNHTYAISFVPKEAKAHVVELKFNGENVPGSPFKCAVVDAARVNLTGDGLEKVPVAKTATFYIEGQTEMGDPEVKVMSPLRKVVPSSIRFVGEGHYGVDYHPADVGDHQVEVKISDLHVQGSPFVVKAYDATKVIVSNFTSGIVQKPVYFSIDASQAGAGNLEIIVSVNGKNVPNYVQSEGNAKFRVNFRPTEPQPHLISVKFNNEPVPNSPFECQVKRTAEAAGEAAAGGSTSTASITGDGIKMCAVNALAAFAVHAAEEETKNYNVTITSPSGDNLEVTVDKGPDALVAEYQPTEVGPHVVKIVDKNSSANVAGSPFTCNVYDARRVSVTGLVTKQPVGKPLTFTVDASQAGEGTLELVVTTARASVRAEVQARSRGLYDVTFVPAEATPHFVNITFNEQDIKHSPFEINVVADGDGPFKHEKRNERFADLVLRGDGLVKATVGRDAMFTVNTKQLMDKVSFRIFDPSGRVVPHRETEVQSGLARITYSPQKVGTYAIHVLDSELNTAGDPIAVDVFDPSLIRLSKIGDVVLGQENKVRVDTSQAGEGALSVSIRSAGQEVRHTIQDLANGQYDILFYPTMAITHKLDIKYNGLPITTNSIETKVRNPMAGKEVTASGRGLYHTRVGKAASFIIHTLGKSSKDFDVIVSGPADVIPPNEAIPVRCYQQKDGNLLAEFITRTSGGFKIEVLESGRPIHGSPFTCFSYDPARVRLVGLPKKDRVNWVDEPISFRVERTEAGFAELDVTVTSPLGGELPLEIKRISKDREIDLVEFVPEAAGNYKFVILYGNEQVPGSPVNFTVEDRRSNELRVYGEGLSSGQVNEEIIFFIEGKQLDGDPVVRIRGSSSTPRAMLQREKNGTYVVSFVPNEVGTLDIKVSARSSVTGQPLERSFQAKISNAKAISPVGGWTRLLDEKGYAYFIPAEETLVEFDTSKAGPGHMQSEVLTQFGEVKSIVEPLDNRMLVRFTPRDACQHNLVLRWNGKPLVRSPIRLLPSGTTNGSGPTNGHSSEHIMDYATSGTGPVAGKVRLTGQGLVTAICGEDNHFTIDGSLSTESGRPEVSMTGGLKADVPVRLRPVGNNIFAATYTPRAPGTYLLNVLWSGRQVKGCPLKVTADPSGTNKNVICSGDGLRVGTLGKDIRSFIDTRKAGPGELSLHCVGPTNKTAYCELNDHQDGTFSLNLKPQEAGKHTLSIRYGGVHVQGSPFVVRVAGAPDPSRVRVYGPGVEHGVLAMYQSRFICDTRGAGAGQLTVRIRGPKGAFRVEMQRESQKDRTILCKYEPTEPGDYRIEVKWSGEHIPGSPFMVMIFDTQEELSRFLQGGYSPNGAISDMYGSIGGHYSSHYGNLNYMTGGGGQPPPPQNIMSWRGSQSQLH